MEERGDEEISPPAGVGQMVGSKFSVCRSPLVRELAPLFVAVPLDTLTKGLRANVTQLLPGADPSRQAGDRSG